MLTLPVGLFIASVLLLWIYFRIKNRRIIEFGNKIPGPYPWPIIGNALQLGLSFADLVNSTTVFNDLYQSNYRIWIGSNLLVMVTELPHVEALLSNPKLLAKPWTYQYSKPWIGDGLLISVGERWKKHRKLITPAFHFKILEGFISVFNAHAETFVKTLAPLVGGPGFNMYDRAVLFTLDGLCETSLGGSLNIQENSDSEYAKAVKDAFSTMVYRSVKPWVHFDFVFNNTPMGKLQKKSLNIIHNFSYNVIKRRRKEIEKEENLSKAVKEDEDMGIRPLVPFLDSMLRASGKGKILSDLDIREELDTIVGAGLETTATAIAFGCWTLAENPHIQEKALMELKDMFGDSDRVPTYDDLNELKYLDMVIREMMRLYPPVPVVGRALHDDIDIGDCVYPAGTNVAILPFFIHRDPRLFPDPLKFDPDRFLPENVIRRHPYSYIPFAAGPKTCIGRKYAMLVMKTAFCALLRKYKMLPGGDPPVLEWRVSLGAKHGINIKLELRDK